MNWHIKIILWHNRLHLCLRKYYSGYKESLFFGINKKNCPWFFPLSLCGHAMSLHKVCVSPLVCCRRILHWETGKLHWE